jgi:hypothetical protein
LWEVVAAVRSDDDWQQEASKGCHDILEPHFFEPILVQEDVSLGSLLRILSEVIGQPKWGAWGPNGPAPIQIDSDGPTQGVTFEGAERARIHKSK